MSSGETVTQGRSYPCQFLHTYVRVLMEVCVGAQNCMTSIIGRHAVALANWGLAGPQSLDRPPYNW